MCGYPGHSIYPSWYLIPYEAVDFADLMDRVISVREAKTPYRKDRPTLLPEVAGTVENTLLMYEVHPILLDYTFDAVCRDAADIIPAILSVEASIKLSRW
jgi:hypothetical protein